jgi:hypothetical protein
VIAITHNIAQSREYGEDKIDTPRMNLASNNLDAAEVEIALSPDPPTENDCRRLLPHRSVELCAGAHQARPAALSL